MKDLWLAGPKGQLSALEEVKAWALRELWKHDGRGSYGMCAFIAKTIRKNDGTCPTRDAVRKLLEHIDADDEWFPGKQRGEKRGRKRVLTGGKAAALCRAAKAIKRSGGEVTYPLLCAAAPNAVRNPSTGNAVDKHAVYSCLKQRCYDKNPDKKWGNRPRLGRGALTDATVKRRYDWSIYMRGQPHTPEWYFENLVWVDICSSLLPTTAAKAAEQALARKGNRVWCSEDALSDDENLRGDKRSLKMNSWDTRRVWWMPLLARGKLHFELLPDDFPGDRREGAAAFVKQVRLGIGRRFPGAAAPAVLFTDRGAGFYFAGNGAITPEFKAALADAGLVAFMGDSAAVQPGKLSDCLLHETAVAWMRDKERKTLPRQPWRESNEQFSRRMKGIVAKINSAFDVTGLCQQLPRRVEQLYSKQGGKLRK